MKNTLGIQFNNDASGKAKSVTIDLKKYGKDLHPFLEKIGAFSDDDQFEKKWSEGISGEQLIERVHNHINELPWEK
jgi:hypothetical protein